MALPHVTPPLLYMHKIRVLAAFAARTWVFEARLCAAASVCVRFDGLSPHGWCSCQCLASPRSLPCAPPPLLRTHTSAAPTSCACAVLAGCAWLALQHTVPGQNIMSSIGNVGHSISEKVGLGRRRRSGL